MNEYRDKIIQNHVVKRCAVLSNALGILRLCRILQWSWFLESTCRRVDKTEGFLMQCNVCVKNPCYHANHEILAAQKKAKSLLTDQSGQLGHMATLPLSSCGRRR